jgi:rhodanese-related sulfurtransferase
MNGLFEKQAARPGGYVDVQPRAVAAARGDVRVIDVREADELRGELGRIPGAEHVPLATVEQAARAWDKDEEVVIVCRSGGRSARAAGLLASMGFRRVMNMAGGMLAWNDARLPVER